MKTTIKKQRRKVGVAGSFFNQLMSNNSSVPVVGKGATRLHYSDRSCYEVVEVSADGKMVKLEALTAKHDKTKEGGMGHQNWVLEPTGNFCIVVWRHNAWRIKGSEVTYTKEYIEKQGKGGRLSSGLTEEQRLAIYAGEVFPQNALEGITERKDTYSKINILFGQKDYYYDWSF